MQVAEVVFCLACTYRKKGVMRLCNYSEQILV